MSNVRQLDQRSPGSASPSGAGSAKACRMVNKGLCLDGPALPVRALRSCGPAAPARCSAAMVDEALTRGAVVKA